MSIVSVPGWLLHALTELHTAEIAGGKDNPRIVGYWKEAKVNGLGPDDDETPWCAAFVGALLFRDGIEATRSGLAKSYATWGDEWTGTGLGPVVVLNRKPLPDGRPAPKWQGHVGFGVGLTGTHVHVLGGNQGNKVSIAAFPRERVLTIRRPKGVTLPTSGMVLPVTAVDPSDS